MENVHLDSKEKKMSIAQQQVFNLVPTTLAEAMDYAKMIADSSICPKDFKGKPGDVLVAMQMGAEVGLKPLQALQNIAVINGRPSIWGDACLALIKAHRDFEDINEWEALDEKGDKTAYCTIKRKGQTPQTRKFSIEDAKKAGLLGKPGSWTQYEPRMLQMRARGFCARDTFPDALRGLILAEEALDLPSEKDITPAPSTDNTAPLSKSEQIKAKFGIASQSEAKEPAQDAEKNEPELVFTLEEVEKKMKSAKNSDELALAADSARHLSDGEREKLKSLYVQKNKEINGQTQEAGR
jgi:hypothetical protein